MKIEIAPSLLAADPGDYKAGAKFAENIGGDLLHIDVMDGSFVPPITFGDNVVKVCKANTKLFLDVHLMISNPEKHFKTFAKAGADRIIFHAEASNDIPSAIKSLNSLGVKSGLAVNPETSTEELLKYLPQLDLALVMTVNPGWGGQAFIEDCLKKVKEIKAKVVEDSLKTNIEVDGGVNSETAKLCIEAGANILVSGSFLYKHSDPESALESLKIV